MLTPFSSPCTLTPSRTKILLLSKSKPSSSVFFVLIVNGKLGVSISNLYVTPLYKVIVGFCVNPSGENTYALLSILSAVRIVYVLSTSIVVPAIPIVCGPKGNQ